MNVAISGSRTFTDRDLVEHVVARLLERGDFIIIGDAPSGVDLFAYEALYGWPGPSPQCRVYYAEWSKFGRAAGHERNGRMIADADLLVAIFAHGPRTPGTSNALGQALRRNLPAYVYHEGRWALEWKNGSPTSASPHFVL